MADFNVNTPEVNPSSQPVAPVAGDTAFADAAGSASRLFSSIAPAITEKSNLAYKQGIKDSTSIKVADFTQQQLKVAQAVDQGKMSSAEAQTRLRSNFYQAIGNNPTIVDQLTEAHKTIIGTDTLGKNVADGTPAEQLERKLKGEAASAGWIKPGMTEQDSDLALSKYQQMKQGEQLLSQTQAQLTLERGKIGLVNDKLQTQQAKQSLATGSITQQTARLNLQEKTSQVSSQHAIGQIQDGYNYKFATDLNAIRTQYDNGPKDAKSKVAYQQQIDNLLANVTQNVSGIGRSAGSDYINNVLTPMKMRADSLKSYVSGDLDSKALETTFNNALAVQKVNITGDPKVAKTLAISSLVRNIGGSFQEGLDATVLKIIGTNGQHDSPSTTPGGNPQDAPTTNLTTTHLDDAKSVDTYLGAMKVGLSHRASGQVSQKDGSLGELQTNMSSILKSIDYYQSAVKNPKQLNKVIDFLASPEYGQFASSEDGKLTEQDAKNASLILERDYTATVTPLLQKEYRSSVTGSEPISGGQFAGLEMRNNELGVASGAKTDTVQQTIKPVFVGSGITFRPNDPGDKDAVAKAKDLNSKVAPIVNKLVRMDAHLQGNTNYKKVWADKYASIFEPEDKADEDKIGQTKVDLSNGE